MATSAIIITQYQGQQAQNLRNVPILLPSIVAVEQGEKTISMAWSLDSIS
ncbi:hypothetical protein IC627_15985 [Photobacterium damselae subsp. piscicida]|uniref:Uncharacterized protein n=1 Tax=Photobacterium damsela subsp. piscicida TaxID=38294 RepID=A0A7L8A9I9_PHODP|nr:hypothetical protein [Photobacterium damselae]QOD58397.1 hypothetical protein IC627_15985 [Photobacterium damselae subsp. piscicida]